MQRIRNMDDRSIPQSSRATVFNQRVGVSTSNTKDEGGQSMPGKRYHGLFHTLSQREWETHWFKWTSMGRRKEDGGLIKKIKITVVVSLKIRNK